MNFIYGDLYENIDKYDHVGFTANSVIKRDNRLVMGAGNAKIVRDKFKDIDLRLGQLISNKEYYVIFDTITNIFALQTKVNYKDNSTIDLITRSIDNLISLIDKNKKYAIPIPGINHGKLNIVDVYKIIKKLPDNVDVWFNNEELKNKIKELVMEDKVENLINVVAYLDGSSWPNPGFCGSGIHGYLYLESDIEVKHTDKPTKINITTNGYVHSDEQAKYDYKSVRPSMYFDAICSYGNDCTNNIGEVRAFVDLVNILYNHFKDLKQPDGVVFDPIDGKLNKLIINTDSMYLLGIIHKLQKKLPNWEDKVKVNLNLWHMVNEALSKLEELNVELIKQKVKGHSGDVGNEIADRLAFIGRNNSSKYNTPHVIFRTSSGKKYWKPDYKKHPFLTFRQLFILNNKRDKVNNIYHYSMMDYKKDVEPGRKSHEAAFGLIIINHRDEMLEDLIDVYHSHMGSMSIISTIDLSLLNTQAFQTNFKLFGKDAFTFNRSGSVLNLLDTTPMVFNVRPTGLANQAMNKILNLQNILDEYKLFKSGKKVNREYHNINDLIYEKNKKGKNVCKLTNVTKKLDITVDGVLYPIELGKDIIDRNALKKIESEEPNVWLVTEKLEPGAIEYYTIVELGTTGDIGIWCNFYNNKVLLSTKEKKKK